jgi:heterodisulfide reductase subunit B
VVEHLPSKHEALSSNTSTTIKSLSRWLGYEKIKEKGHKIIITEMKKGCHYEFYAPVLDNSESPQMPDPVVKSLHLCLR